MTTPMIFKAFGVILILTVLCSPGMRAAGKRGSAAARASAGLQMGTSMLGCGQWMHAAAKAPVPMRAETSTPVRLPCMLVIKHESLDVKLVALADSAGQTMHVRLVAIRILLHQFNLYSGQPARAFIAISYMGIHGRGMQWFRLSLMLSREIQ